MSPRTVAILLGAALAVSVAVNVFAATAAYTALNSHHSVEPHRAPKPGGDSRPTAREVVDALPPETRERVRASLRQASLAARPDFQQARELRRQAVAAAAVDPFDAARVSALLGQSRAAERRGRERLESQALTIMGDLSPQDRVVFSRILNNRGKGEPQRGAGVNNEKAK